MCVRASLDFTYFKTGALNAELDFCIGLAFIVKSRDWVKNKNPGFNI